MKCPNCGRASLQESKGRPDRWCRYVADCGYSDRKPVRVESHVDRATNGIGQPGSAAENRRSESYIARHSVGAVYEASPGFLELAFLMPENEGGR